MRRRNLLKLAAGATMLAAPRIGNAQAAKPLRFAPVANLAALDPVWTSARPTRNHAFLVFDMLYGLDESFAAQPQMVAGHTVEEDGKIWTLTLRENLRFHDGGPVLGRDVVASVQRFGARDAFGQALLTAADEITVTGDRTIRFRLNRPFPHLPLALAGSTGSAPVIMPERLANTDPFQRVSEMVGSGPYRFLASEHVAGARAAYTRFEGYVPRSEGKPSYSAGPKVASIERVEWVILPDPATCAASLRTGEIDWWEFPSSDLSPTLAADGSVRLLQNEPANTGIMRFNQLHPPFDNPAIRRLVLSAINQADAMTAVAGVDPKHWQDNVGLFPHEMALATDAGIEVLTRPRDYEAVKRDLAAAGYHGERVVALMATDIPVVHALAQVAIDQLTRAGFNVDAQAMDFGTLISRRTRREPPDKGGWNVLFTFLDGIGNFNPANNFALAANGAKAWFGWPDSPDIEALRAAWLEESDLEAQRKICRALQIRLWQDVPYVPMGAYYQPTAVRADLVDVRKGPPQFYGVRRG
jgi:peptide/nickel transport system substrate-binding protein